MPTSLKLSAHAIRTTGSFCCLGILCALTMFIAGCSSGSSMSKLIPSPNPPVADVPIPIGFHIDLSHSQSTYVPKTNLRMVNQEYKGSDPRLSVARFYEDNMPGSGWKTISLQGSQRLVLNFSKAGEICTVTITHGWFHTHIYVVIAPMGSATTQPGT